MRLFALFGLGFPPAPRLLSLNLAAYGNSQAHSTKGTPSPPTRLRPLVGPRFQVLFHSPPGVLFTFPSRYYALSVAAEYSALEGGPPCFRLDSSCPGVLRYGAKRLPRASPTGLSPAPAGLPRPFGCARNHRRLPRRRPTTPPASPPSVWAPPRSLAATGGISFDFFSCGYLDGSLPRVSPPHTISFMCGCSPFQVSGLPHSETPASSDVCSYTGLFAACRVLPRLAAPRHPPWTLFSLDHIVLLVTLSLLNVKNLKSGTDKT